MTILYEQKPKGLRYSYKTDTTQPRDRNKFIAGMCDTVAQIRNSVARYLGHKRFKLVRVMTANAPSSGTRDDKS